MSENNYLADLYKAITLNVIKRGHVNCMYANEAGCITFEQNYEKGMIKINQETRKY